MIDLRLHRRRQTYTTLVAIALGMVLVGLAIPWIAGERVQGSSVGAGPNAGLDAGETTSGTTFETTTTTAAPTTRTAAGTAAGAPAGSSGTSSGAGRTATSAGATSVGAAGGGATDMGVTPTTVKIGFLLLDVGNVSKVGVGVPGVDPKQQQEAIQVHIDEINDAGGIAGRRIEPFFRAFDVLSQDDMRAACLAVTEDAKVFAVVAAGGYEASPGMCVTKEHRTPLVLHCCAIDEFFAESEGRMFTLFAGATRLMHMWIHELDRANRLQGKKIGVLNDERYDPGEKMAKTALIPAMDRYGYTITHRSRLAEDLSTGASQIPNEVQQMRLKGVEVVLLTANTIYSSQFVQQADAQGWHPTYYTSDWAGMYTDATNQNMPQSYDKTLGWTVARQREERAKLPEPAPAAACRTRYEAATGKKLDRNAGSVEYGVVIMWCDLFDLALAGLRGADAELTRVRFGEAIQNTGPIGLGSIGGGGFRPGRFDSAELIRMQQWFADCRCWKPAADFVRTPY